MLSNLYNGSIEMVYNLLEVGKPHLFKDTTPERKCVECGKPHKGEVLCCSKECFVKFKERKKNGHT
jgi:hypothetical protein